MSISIGEIIVWLIVGALAATLAGRLMTFTKRGFGLWINLGVGMLAALVGGFLFCLFQRTNIASGDSRIPLNWLATKMSGYGVDRAVIGAASISARMRRDLVGCGIPSRVQFTTLMATQSLAAAHTML